MEVMKTLGADKSLRWPAAIAIVDDDPHDRAGAPDGPRPSA
jgi:hypothetical protein